MTCSISFGRSTLRRLASALAAVLLAAAASGEVPLGVGQRGDLEQAWFRVADALEPAQFEDVTERVDELLQVARRLEIKRLTPFATALIIRARKLDPFDARPLLEQAVRLDPWSPEAWLAVARARFQHNAPIQGSAAFVRAAASLFVDDRLQHLLGPSAVQGLLPPLLLGLALWTLILIRTVLVRLWHDLSETGSLLKLGPNAPVFAVVAIALPLFAAGDPIWLLLWVLALGWAYLPPMLKLQGAGVFVVVALTPILLTSSFIHMTHRRNAIQEATSALQARRYDPRALEDLVALAPDFGDQPHYYRLLGDCFRQQGLYDTAAWSYREGLRLAPESGELALALGTVDYLQGDYNASLQAFDAARQNGADPVVTNYNLSLTLSQTYHFRESEEAMLAARAADGPRLHKLTSGRDQQQLIVPRFTHAEATLLLASEDQVTLLNRGLLPPPLERERTIFHPLAIGSVLFLVLAIGHFLVREHTGGLAKACIKCGRAFCSRCKLSRESQSYCTQCVNIFLRKDMVAIEAQLEKRKQVARYSQLTLIERRVFDLLLPGAGISGAGRPVLGAFLSLVALLSLSAALSWLPNYLSPLLLDAWLRPLQVLAVLTWLLTMIAAQVARADRS